MLELRIGLQVCGFNGVVVFDRQTIEDTLNSTAILPEHCQSLE